MTNAQMTTRRVLNELARVFDLSWFSPAIREYRCMLGRIPIALLFWQALALTLPLSCALAEQVQGAAGPPNPDPFHGDGSMNETWRKSQILGSGLSADITPTPITLGNVTYLIPRNYIYNRYLGTLKVTYPDFKPFNEETKDCFDAKIAYQTGCRTIEIRLGPGGNTGRKALETGLNNMNLYRLKHEQAPITPRKGPYGYDIYDFGPDDARSEEYFRADLNIYFSCFIHIVNGSRDATCDDTFALEKMHGRWASFLD
jgi:hypothetical protein